MKQTISINLAGLVFHIEKDAFDQLQHYLDQVKQHLENNESREEILQDIESRIAEIFQERTGSRKEAVTIEDMQAVKSSLGEPEAFSTGNSNSEDEQKEEKTYTRKGQIHRDVDNKVIGGVCSGIGQYYGFDPLWLRLAFVLAVLLSGTGILVYLILWIIIPAAKTPVQKMEMRGERVTVSNIKKSFSGKSHSHKTHHQQHYTEQRNDFARQGKGALKKVLDSMETGFDKLKNACRKATTKLEQQ